MHLIWYYWLGEEKQIPSIEIRICNTQPKSSIRDSSSRNLFKLNCPSTFVSHNASKLFDKKKIVCNFVARQLIIYLQNVKHMYQPVVVLFSESTHSRVMYFSIFSMCCLLGLATWQVLYLRRFFKAKKLIEWTRAI